MLVVPTSSSITATFYVLKKIHVKTGPTYLGRLSPA
jgi:hypothetical protein